MWRSADPTIGHDDTLNGTTLPCYLKKIFLWQHLIVNFCFLLYFFLLGNINLRCFHYDMGTENNAFYQTHRL